MLLFMPLPPHRHSIICNRFTHYLPFPNYFLQDRFMRVCGLKAVLYYSFPKQAICLELNDNYKQLRKCFLGKKLACLGLEIKYKLCSSDLQTKSTRILLLAVWIGLQHRDCHVGK